MEPGKIFGEIISHSMPGAGLKCFVYAFCLGAGTNAASFACTEMGQGSI